MKHWPSPAASLGYRFIVDFDYCTPAIPRGPGGKFEDFICEIAD